MIPIILIGAAYLIGKMMEGKTYSSGGKLPLLAPNGLPSKLKPEQYKLVRTPKFKAWFGDWENDAENASKVIDEETKEPLVCYHGTPNKITKNFFDKKKVGYNTYNALRGFYFTDNISVAKSYTYDNNEEKYLGSIIEVFLNVKNIAIIDAEKMSWFYLSEKINIDENIKFFLEIGYNGVMVKNIKDPFIDDENGADYLGNNFIVDESNQIKLADGTNTTFNGTNSDIRYEIGGIFQGTPHDFDEYSTDYMGTGEGVQAFGWGLYFTNKKDIAKNYAKNESLIEREISKKSNDFSHVSIYSNIPSFVVDKLGYLKGKLKEFENLKKEYKKDSWDNEIDKYSSLIDLVESYKGNIYSATLFKGKKSNEYDLLNWEEKPNEKQINKIIKQAKKEGVNLSKLPFELKKYRDCNAIYSDLSTIISGKSYLRSMDSGKNCSLFLLRAGIDGIKYKAGTLSGMESDDGYNYVIFDAEDVNIEGKEKFNEGGIIEPAERTEWNGYKVGDVIDGGKLDELSGGSVGNNPKKKFILVQVPLSKFKENRKELLSENKGYEEEEIERLEVIKHNFEKTPPIPNEGDGMHRIVSAKELGHKTILMWQDLSSLKSLEQLDYQLRYPKENKLLFLDADKLLKRHSIDSPSFDITVKENQIGNRVQKAKDYISDYLLDNRWINRRTNERKNIKIKFEPSVVGIYNGKLGFEDGRHRVLAAKELGFKKVAVEVPKEQVAEFEKSFK